ncbi:hypothetical protein D3C78_1515310 [compost metagenome]
MIKAACGPYIAAWINRPTTTARQISTGWLLSSSIKNTNAQTIAAKAPPIYTGRRPKRSDSAPNIGTVIALPIAPNMVAANATGRGRFNTVVT